MDLLSVIVAYFKFSLPKINNNKRTQNLAAQSAVDLHCLETISGLDNNTKYFRKLVFLIFSGIMLAYTFLIKLNSKIQVAKQLWGTKIASLKNVPRQTRENTHTHIKKKKKKNTLFLAKKRRHVSLIYKCNGTTPSGRGYPKLVFHDKTKRITRKIDWH